jgi:hypothetical protein
MAGKAGETIVGCENRFAPRYLYLQLRQKNIWRSMNSIGNICGPRRDGVSSRKSERLLARRLESSTPFAALFGALKSPGQDPLIFQRVIVRNAQRLAIRTGLLPRARIELSGGSKC